MDAPVTVRAAALHTTLPRGGASTTHLVIRTRACAERAGPRPRLTTVLVIDVSGSMKGEPLAQVIRSAQMLAEILPDGDALGVVTFDSEARTVAEPRPLDAGRRAELKRLVAGLRAGSNTNLSAGLARGALLLPPRAPDERQLLLVLTDGQANEGTRTAEGLAREAALIREREVAVSALGYGARHDEDVLVALARAGGGRYAFVQDPLLARSSFVRALGSQLDVVAEDVRLVVTPDPGVELVRVLGDVPTSVGTQGLTIKLQDPLAGEEASVVVEVAVSAPPRTGPFHLAEVTVTGRAVGAGWPFASGALATVTFDTAPGPLDAEVGPLVAIGLADELREEARRLGDRRDFAGAIAVLERAVALVQRAPGWTPAGGGPLGDAVDALRDDIAAYRRVPSEAELIMYKKAQCQDFDFAAGTKAFTNQVGRTAGTVHLSDRALGRVPAARLVVVGPGPLAGRGFPVEAEATLGRGQDVEVALEDAGVSRRHARIVYDGADFWLFDLGSSNATRVHGQPIQRHRLRPGDLVQVGGVVLRFEREGAGAAA